MTGGAGQLLVLLEVACRTMKVDLNITSVTRLALSTTQEQQRSYSLYIIL